MIWKKFNDQIALILIVFIVGLWIVDPMIKGYWGSGLPESVIGATVVIITLIAQFYFRRKEPDEGNGGTK